MHTAKLSEFLLHGKLGPIRAGFTSDQVRAVLGEAEGVLLSSRPSVWKYASLELGFDLDVEPMILNFLGLYYRTAPFQAPAAIQFSGWWPSLGMRLDDFKAGLRELDLVFDEDEHLTSDEQVALKIGERATVTFDREPINLDREQGIALIDSMQVMTRKVR